jgi:molybdenum cofactor synthesis domain-containing protein
MPKDQKTVRAALVIIGDEILSGRTEDANLNYLARWLGEVGITLAEVRVVADDQDDVVRAVNDCRPRYDYVFTTGGIGPTHDDITAQCIAAAFNVPLQVNAEARRILEGYSGEGHVNEARMRMAQVPAGATLIDNPVSAAPGFQMDNVFVLAGIPVVMQAMLEKLRDRLEGGARVTTRSLTVHAGESNIAAVLGAVQECHGSLSLGSYPFFRQSKEGRGRVGTCLVFRGVDGGEIDVAMGEIKAALEQLSVEFEDGEPELPHQKG